jgi:outer membrane protein
VRSNRAQDCARHDERVARRESIVAMGFDAMSAARLEHAMKITTLITTGAVALGLFAANGAAASPWSVRLRATYLQTADKSDAFSALGTDFARNAIAVSDKLMPEIDIVYAFNDVFSAELVLTVPQEHNVDLAGVGRLGTFKHLPPTLLFQYRPKWGDAVRPYVGLGVNHTFVFDEDMSVAGVPLALERSSTGIAAQVGVDVAVGERWSINFDVKYAALGVDVLAGGVRLTEARLNPWLYSLGVHYQF